MKKYDTKKLKEILVKLYGERYIVPDEEYNGPHKKYTLICQKHGSFQCRFDKLLTGKCECPICRENRKLQEKLNLCKERATNIHNGKYDYSLITVENFKNMETRVPIICKKHGVFYQTFNNHINSKQGCQKCYDERRKGKTKLTREEFIEKASKVHNNFYSYDKLVYYGMKKKVTITCPIHGDFEQVAYDHLRGFKCAKCKYDDNRDTIEEFVKKTRIIHGDKYDYSKIVY